MIARHGVQLPLHYIHFKIEKFSRSDDGVFSLYKGFVDPIVSRVVESCKVAKVVFFFHFPANRVVSLNKRLAICFGKTFSLAGKKM